jgi:hypothetical protein
MAWNFPDSPSEGQQFVPAAGAPVYVYRAPAWELVSLAGASIGDTPPANPVHGQQFWESDTGNLYIYYTDQTPNSQWVQVNGAGLPEAPLDAKSYARKSGAWSAAADEAPNDGNAYVRQGNAWVLLDSVQALKKIGEGTISTPTAYCVISLAPTGGYHSYEITLDDVMSGNDVQGLYVQFSSDNGSTWVTGTPYAYSTDYVIVMASPTFTANGAAGVTAIRMATVSSNPNNKSFFKLSLSKPIAISGATAVARLLWQGSNYNGTTYMQTRGTGLNSGNNAPFTHIRFWMETGNIWAMRWVLNGLKGP